MKIFLKNSKRGAATIEASLIFVFFMIGYFILNNIAISLITESLTRKALFEMGMEVSSYVQIIDRLGYSQQVKTHTISEENYKEIILNELNDGIDDQSLNTIFDSLLDLTKNNLSNTAKKYLYEKVLKNLFVHKLNNIKKIANFDTLGVVGGIDGFNFRDTKILEDGNYINLSLNYTFKIDKFGFMSTTNEVEQNLLIDTWVNNINNKSFYSIWNESNFDRGIYFAKKIRNQSDMGLKTGKGFDYYEESSNTLVQVISLNIFNKSYSQIEENNYLVSEIFFQQIKTYYNKMKKNLEKVGESMETLDGKTIEINNPNIRLQIILPEEAVSKTDITQYINSINSQIGNIEFTYMEKAFDD